MASKVAKFKKRRKAARKSPRKSNPDRGEMTELGVRVGAGFAGYTMTRLVSRVAYSQAIKKFPNNAKHAAFVASAAGAAAAYFGSSKWDKLADYHDEISIGAGIALFQSFIQTYLPQYGWIVGDLSAEQYQAAAKKTAKEAEGAGSFYSSVPSLPGVPDALPAHTPRGPEMGSEDELSKLLEEAGFEEGDTIGQLPPADDGVDFDALGLGGLGSLGDAGDGLGDYSEMHEIH